MDQRRERGAHRRTFATVGFIAAGALLASTAVTGTAFADPSADDVRSKIEKLQEEYAELAEAYNQAKEDHDAAKSKLADIRKERKEVQEKLEDMQSGVRELATAAYSGADYGSVPFLVSSSGPEEALEQASDLGYLSQSQQDKLGNYTEEKDKLDKLEAEADDTEDEAKEKLEEAEEAKSDSEEKIAEQEAILDGLTDEERAQASEGVDGGSSSSGSSGGGSTGGASYNGSATGNAKTAIDFIYAQIGDSYSLGANGPDVWDCSSLVQAAWREAGVSLPRTTYDQINAGTSVSYDNLQPGDLVFFYSGPSHVGMYVGDGKMVHASNPSKPVAEVQMSPYWSGQFTGAIRP
ncbi:C40 family peptidase [Nocardiopsis composta]|uniref:Cell wall-associated NlpC family hydrolase n=1 Tax=Nocardiopsis composta TaxID=157465 RepID=A0A7W8VH06_9ACTN|nr:C40 family peptidase [Nocardiopsis composta]MBB5435685.1 cell wall-associated NlpC family hydrolase [Nocardiopsis composta]